MGALLRLTTDRPGSASSAPLYSTESPELFGFPFFYWYQFAWVPVTAGLTYLVYRKTRTSEPSPADRGTGRFRREVQSREVAS